MLVLQLSDRKAWISRFRLHGVKVNILTQHLSGELRMVPNKGF